MAIVGPQSVMGSSTPNRRVRAEVMIGATAPENGRRKSTPGRIKAPTEGTEKDAIPGKKSVSVKPGIPVPAVAEPPKTAPRIYGSRIGIRFGKVSGTKSSPAIEVFRLQCLF